MMRKQGHSKYKQKIQTTKTYFIEVIWTSDKNSHGGFRVYHNHHGL